jgi:hypothetical protein
VDTPVGRAYREQQVERDHQADGGRIAPVKFQQQHAEHEGELDDGRNKGHQRHARNVLYSEAPTLQYAGEPTGLALQVKAQ